MKDTHSRFQVTCAWCKMVLVKGRGPEADRISHGQCCECLAKYFPTFGEASECQLEILNRDHQELANGTTPGNIVSHLDTMKCKVCGREVELEPEPCDCHSGE